jgi:tetratricopeptide (TPR) repeat protein
MEPVDKVVLSRLKAFDGRTVSVFLNFVNGSTTVRSAILTLVINDERCVIDNFYIFSATLLGKLNPFVQQHIEDVVWDEYYRNFPSAVKNLEEILSADTSFVVREFAYNNLAEMHYNLGDYSAALSSADQAIKHSPQNSHAYYLKHRAQHFVGDHRGALQSISTAIDLNPTSSFYYINRSTLYRFLKKKKLARNDLIQCKALALIQKNEELLEMVESELVRY